MVCLLRRSGKIKDRHYTFVSSIAERWPAHLLNLFAKIRKSICPNWKMYLSIWKKNKFVQIIKCTFYTFAHVFMMARGWAAHLKTVFVPIVKRYKCICSNLKNIFLLWYMSLVWHDDGQRACKKMYLSKL